MSPVPLSRIAIATVILTACGTHSASSPQPTPAVPVAALPPQGARGAAATSVTAAAPAVASATPALVSIPCLVTSDRVLFAGAVTLKPDAEHPTVLVPLRLTPQSPGFIDVRVGVPYKTAEDAPLVWGGPIPQVAVGEAPAKVESRPSITYGVVPPPHEGESWSLALQRAKPSEAMAVWVLVTEPSFQGACE